MRVSEIMNSSLTYFTKNTTVREASERLVRANLTGAPVVDGNQVIGTISRTDILHSIRTNYNEMKMVFPHILGVSFVQVPVEKMVSEAFNELLSRPVEDIMQREVCTINSMTDIDDAIKKMVAQNLAVIPVVDDGHLVGMLTIDEVFKTLAIQQRGTELVPAKKLTPEMVFDYLVQDFSQKIGNQELANSVIKELIVQMGMDLKEVTYPFLREMVETMYSWESKICPEVADQHKEKRLQVLDQLKEEESRATNADGATYTSTPTRFFDRSLQGTDVEADDKFLED